MNKTEFVEKFAEMNKISLKLSKLVIETILDSIKESLYNNKRVEIRGFGSFNMKEYKPYSGRNPKTGEKIQVLEKISPFFKASKAFNKLSTDKQAER